jgi:serine/threonine protein kinase
LHYKAPEVFKGKYDARVDIWAVGIMFYQMYTGEHPFIGKTDDETTAKILKGEPDFSHFAFHESMKDFCMKMLHPKRKHRATAQ